MMKLSIAFFLIYLFLQPNVALKTPKLTSVKTRYEHPYRLNDERSKFNAEFNERAIHRCRRTSSANPFKMTVDSTTTSLTTEQNNNSLPKLLDKNIVKRWITGLSLGGICSLWIASGTPLFALGFILTTLITQKEFDNMVIGAGFSPTTKTSLISAVLIYVSAAAIPKFHEFMLPLSTIFMLVSLLLGSTTAPISKISCSMLGTVYLSYMPSFWLRLRGLSKLNTFMSLRPIFNSAATPNFFVSRGLWTCGAAVTWWTWTSIVFADVGAYFFGKKLGKNKLSCISKAAGEASPNKTVEGALGGSLCCALLMTLGAYTMNWPLWQITGPFYGFIMSAMGLIGDLTASMMKRNAGMKDTGDILPGHGGLLDRIDSYMLSAPVAFFLCNTMLEVAAKVARKG